MATDNGLICAYRLDGAGGAEQLDWAGVSAWTPGQGTLWVHLDRLFADAQTWLREHSGVDSVTAEALLAEETRPRCVAQGDGLIVIMRGVNLNSGADPEDMVSIRIWVEDGRLISIRHRRLLAVTDIREALDRHHGPGDAATMLVSLIDRLTARIGPVIDDIEDRIDGLEEGVIVERSAVLRQSLADLRRQAIILRRFIAPERDALARLLVEPAPWLGAGSRQRLREAADRVTRYVEDLDAARERAAVAQDELASLIAEQSQHTIYVLSVVASLFLPLGLITGLLGINVGGIPMADSSWGFALVSLVLVGLAGFQFWLFRRMKWL